MKKILLMVSSFLIFTVGCAGNQVTSCDMPKIPACNCPDEALAFSEHFVEHFNKTIETAGGAINEFLSFAPAEIVDRKIHLNLLTKNLTQKDQDELAPGIAQLNYCSNWTIVVPNVVFVIKLNGEELNTIHCNDFLM